MLRHNRQSDASKTELLPLYNDSQLSLARSQMLCAMQVHRDEMSTRWYRFIPLSCTIFANCRIRAHVWKNCRGIPSIRSREGSILFRGLDQSPYNTAPSARISLFRHGLIPAGILGASASRQVTLVTTQPQWPQILSGDYQLQDLGFHYHNPPFINSY